MNKWDSAKIHIFMKNKEKYYKKPSGRHASAAPTGMYSIGCFYRTMSLRTEVLSAVVTRT